MYVWWFRTKHVRLGSQNLVLNSLYLMQFKNYIHLKLMHIEHTVLNHIFWLYFDYVIIDFILSSSTQKQTILKLKVFYNHFIQLQYINRVLVGQIFDFSSISRYIVLKSCTLISPLWIRRASIEKYEYQWTSTLYFSLTRSYSQLLRPVPAMKISKLCLVVKYF